MRAPGRLLASGRDADIFECGPRSVLRRSRRGRSLADEARTMEYARQHGYPVPAVEEVSADGTELVMERADGPSMVALLGKRPWTLRRQAGVLADLHRRLHQIEGPDWLPAAPGGAGTTLVHLDLHPLNIIVADRGPVVIDWANASRGIGEVDVVLAWVLLASGEIPDKGIRATVLGQGRSLFVNSFLRHFDRRALRPHLGDVVAWKVTDANMSEGERRTMRALADAYGAAGTS
ncbi:MAG: phosphotransferase [Acidimicrobiia bacterium]|nr:phosphotransferase [Acidimicrobiia bacterium]